MVENAKDPVTEPSIGKRDARLTGCAVRFSANWTRRTRITRRLVSPGPGPSQAQEAFNQGQSIFRNNGVNQTPGALAVCMSKAADGEKEAAKLGVRAAFNAQMANPGDPAAYAAMLANTGVNQQTLAAVLGSDEADNLTKQLTFKYEDPVGNAFRKGHGPFQIPSGRRGHWRHTRRLALLDEDRQPSRDRGASPRRPAGAIEQALTSARQGDLSQARSMFAKSGANREKASGEVFPEGQKNAGSQLDAELTKRGERIGRSRTRHRPPTSWPIQQKYSPAASSSGDPTAAIIGGAAGGGVGAAAAAAGKAAFGGLTNAFTEAARNRLLEGTAREAGRHRPGARARSWRRSPRAYRAQPVTQGVAGAGSAGANLLSRPPVQKGLRAKLEEMPIPAGQ